MRFERRGLSTVGVAASVLVFVAAGCGGSSNSLDCGAVRPVTASRIPGANDGVAFGPLQLIGLGTFRTGAPTKVLIGVVRPLRRPLTIRGRRCSDGRRLRFFYARGTQGQQQLVIHAPGPPYAIAVLERAGQPTAYLKEGARDFFTGYFLFPTAGKYEVKLYAGTSHLDTAVISTAEAAR